MMRLIPVKERSDAAGILYRLLMERPEEACISHKQMPSWEEHLAFVKKMTPDSPGGSKDAYGDWNLIEKDGDIVGAVYVTKRDEIGIDIFEKFRGARLGPMAVKLQMRAWGSDRILANVAPANKRSARMFKQLGFRLVQHTYQLEDKAAGKVTTL